MIAFLFGSYVAAATASLDAETSGAVDARTLKLTLVSDSFSSR